MSRYWYIAYEQKVSYQKNMLKAWAGVLLFSLISILLIAPKDDTLPVKSVRAVTVAESGGRGLFRGSLGNSYKIVPDFVPVDSEVTFASVSEPLKSPSVSFPVAALREGFADGDRRAVIIPERSFVEKPKTVIKTKQKNIARVEPLSILWPAHTSTSIVGRVRIAVQYDSKGLIVKDSIESEYPMNLGFGYAVTQAVRAKKILASEPTRIVWDLELKYGEKPVVKFASAGVEVLE